MFLSSCIFTNKQVKIDACSRINTQIIERQHVLRSNNVQQNTCTVVNTEDYKIYSISPIFPNEALEKNIEGIVRIQFSVTPNGNIINPRIINSTALGIFDDAAIKTIKLWRFQAISKRAKSEEIEVIQEMRFKSNRPYILEVDPHINAF